MGSSAINKTSTSCRGAVSHSSKQDVPLSYRLFDCTQSGVALSLTVTDASGVCWSKPAKHLLAGSPKMLRAPSEKTQDTSGVAVG